MRDDDIPAEAVPLAAFLQEIGPDDLKSWLQAKEACRIARENHFEDVLALASRHSYAAAVAVHQRARGKMLSGEFVGFGHDTERYDALSIIPREAWPRLVIADNLNDAFVGLFQDKVLDGNGVDHGPGYGPLLPPKGFRAIRIAPAAAVSPEAACRAWLAGEVAKGPPSKPKVFRIMKTGNRDDTPDNSYWAEARERFPGLSKRAFEAIWAEMTRGRRDWTGAGRPPKK